MSISITSLKHAFAVAAHDLLVGAKAVEAVAAKIAGEATVVEPIVNALLAADPAALAVARAGEALLGEVCGAIAAAGTASAAKRLSISLDEALMADIIAIYNSLKGHPAVAAVPAVK